MAPVLKAGETLPAGPASHPEILQVLNVWEISPPENYLHGLVYVERKKKEKKNNVNGIFDKRLANSCLGVWERLGHCLNCPSL